jgi:hypothetical protein
VHCLEACTKHCCTPQSASTPPRCPLKDMQPPHSSDRIIAAPTSSRPPGNSRGIPVSASSTKANTEERSVDSEPPCPKRLKTSHAAGNITWQVDMNKGKGPVPRTGFVDLTRQSQFDPQNGVKRLVIKNLRTSSPKDADEYYTRVWAELDSALTSVCRPHSLKYQSQYLMHYRYLSKRNSLLLMKSYAVAWRQPVDEAVLKVLRLTSRRGARFTSKINFCHRSSKRQSKITLKHCELFINTGYYGERSL